MTPMVDMLARAVEEYKNMQNRNAARLSNTELLERMKAAIEAGVGVMKSKCIVLQGPLLQAGGKNIQLNSVVYCLSSQLPESPPRTEDEQVELDKQLQEVIDLKDELMRLMLNDGQRDAVFELGESYVAAARKYARSPLPISKVVVTLHKECIYAFQGMGKEIDNVLSCMGDMEPVQYVMMDCPKQKPGIQKLALGKGAGGRGGGGKTGKSRGRNGMDTLAELEATKRAKYVELLLKKVELRVMPDGSMQGEIPLSHRAVAMQIETLPAVKAGLHAIALGRALTDEEIVADGWTSKEWEEYEARVLLHGLQSSEFQAKGYEFPWSLIMPEDLMRSMDDATLHAIRTRDANVNFAYMRRARPAPTTAEMPVPTALTVLSYFSCSVAEAPDIPQGGMPWLDHHEVGVVQLRPHIHGLNIQTLFFAKDNTLAYVDKWGFSTRVGDSSMATAYAALHDSRLSVVVHDTTVDASNNSHYLHVPVFGASNSLSAKQLAAFGALSLLVAGAGEGTWSSKWYCHDEDTKINNASETLDFVDNANVYVQWVRSTVLEPCTDVPRQLQLSTTEKIFFVDGVFEPDRAKIDAFMKFNDILEEPTPLADDQVAEMLARHKVDSSWSATGSSVEGPSVLMFGARFFDLYSNEIEFEVRSHDDKDDEEGEKLALSSKYKIIDPATGLPVIVMEYHGEQDMLLKTSVLNHSDALLTLTYATTEGDAIPFGVCKHPAQYPDVDVEWELYEVYAHTSSEICDFPFKKSHNEMITDAILVKQNGRLMYMLLFKLAVPIQLGKSDHPAVLGKTQQPAVLDKICEVGSMRAGLGLMEVDEAKVNELDELNFDELNLGDSKELVVSFMLRLIICE